LGVNGSYTHYKTTDIPYAWYKPAVEFGFSGRYEFVNKIVINAKASYFGPVWAAIPVAGNSRSTAKYTFESQKIKGWTDISLGAEYKFNKALSFWLNVNNLTNSKYYRWYNYRSYGINILGGLSYSF
jgi:outer membrane receptor protein involved in Fe transport